MGETVLEAHLPYCKITHDFLRATANRHHLNLPVDALVTGSLLFRELKFMSFPYTRTILDVSAEQE